MTKRELATELGLNVVTSIAASMLTFAWGGALGAFLDIYHVGFYRSYWDWLLGAAAIFLFYCYVLGSYWETKWLRIVMIALMILTFFAVMVWPRWFPPQTGLSHYRFVLFHVFFAQLLAATGVPLLRRLNRFF